MSTQVENWLKSIIGGLIAAFGVAIPLLICIGTYKEKFEKVVTDGTSTQRELKLMHNDIDTLSNDFKDFKLNYQLGQQAVWRAMRNNGVVKPGYVIEQYINGKLIQIPVK